MHFTIGPERIVYDMGNRSNESSSFIYITVLNVISALSVVGLHTNGCFWQFSKERWWFTANIIESVLYFAVPCFFMMTGATLLDYAKQYDTKIFFVRCLKKTVIPFIFWSLVALLFRIYFFKNISWNVVTVSYVVDGVLNTKFNGLFWFFPPLFGLYLSIPLFACLDENKNVTVLKYLAGSCFLLNCLIPFLLTVFKIKIRFPIVVAVGSGYLLYLILGYLFNKLDFSKKEKRIIYLLAFLGLLVHMCGTYFVSMEAGKIIKIYKGYNNVPCILYSMGIFLFIKENVQQLRTESFRMGLQLLKDYTFSIYLLHWFVMHSLIRAFHIDTHSIIYRLGGIFLISFICVCITWAIRKIPWLGRKILP